MKKVIFVCLLSVAMCFSAPQADQATKALEGQKIVTPNTAVLPKAEVTANTATNPPAGNATPPVVATNATVEVSTNATAASDPKSNQTQPSTQNTKLPDAKNSVTPAQTIPAKNATTDVPSTTNNTTVDKNNTTVDKNNTIVNNSTVNNNTKHDDGKKPQPATNDTATVMPPVKPTEASKAENTTKQNVVLQTRSFDGPSFIGGIILTLGLIAVGFMGLKYYRAQTERNYHTL